MIGLIWNIRGLGQPRKIQCLCDTIAKTNPDFIGFQETKREVIAEGFFKTIDRFSEYAWHFLPADNTAGGILLGFKENVYWFH